MQKNIKQAFEQAPWRIQLRSFVWILLVVVCFFAVAIFNLNISSRTYAAGVAIQDLETEKRNTMRQIADLRHQLAMIKSSAEMEKRLGELGYERISDPDELVYLVIPGYLGEQPVYEIPVSQKDDSVTLIKPAYTQSLWELIIQQTLNFSKAPERILR